MTAQPRGIEAQRELFPRGLEQPEGGYRFSLDSLLLASFIRWPKSACKPFLGLDLGCGCGVISLAILLADESGICQLTGIDFQDEMIKCAQNNARKLGFSEKAVFKNANVSSYADADHQMHFVVANPPYRIQGRGRVSTGESRSAARFEDEAGVAAFCKAATRSLRDKAPFYMVHLPERLTEAMEACREAGLMPKRVRFVHSRKEEPARIMLLESRKNGGAGISVDPPLFLYEGSGDETRMTRDALAFCSYLQCNAGK